MVMGTVTTKITTVDAVTMEVIVARKQMEKK